MSGPGLLLVRCDANVAIGTGHAMRCLALGQAWQDIGGRVVFAMARTTTAVAERLQSEGIATTLLQVNAGSAGDAQALAALAEAQDARWVVADGYDFGPEYHSLLKVAGIKLLVVDDTGEAGNYCADVVLNQNVYANVTLYAKRAPGVRLLLGPRFCLLRREFASWRTWRREIPPQAKAIIVTMGGSDDENVTLRAIEAIRSLGNQHLETTVVVGGSNPHAERLERAVKEAGQAYTLVRDASNMPKLLSVADLAVAGAGTTCWEMCLLGLPAILCVLADNQEGIASSLASRSIARSLGRFESVSVSRIQEAMRRLIASQGERQRMSDRGRALIDGNGATRVVALLQDDLRIRRTVVDDCRILWEWANDRYVRAASFSQGPISWGTHVEWLGTKLADPCAFLYTATYSDAGPIGQVRFQHAGGRATVSIGLGRRFRRKGLGRILLLLACERFLEDSTVKAIDAYVKPDNEPALRLFTGAGFRRLESDLIAGQPAIHYIFERESGSAHDSD